MNRRRVLGVGLADSTGLGMYLAFSAVYLQTAVHLSDRQIGLLLGMAGIASVLGAIPVAVFAQRVGLRTGLLVLFLMRAASFAVLGCASSFAVAAVGATLGGLLSRSIGPLVQSALIAEADSADAVKQLATLRSLRNAGMAAGALPVSFAVAISTTTAYRAVMFTAVALFLVCALVSSTFPATGEVKQPVRRRGGGVGSNRPFLAVTAVYGALTLSAILLGVGLPLWITQRSHAPGWTVGLVQLVNTVLVVALQVRVSRGSEDPARGRRMLLAGGLLSAVAALTAPLCSFGASWFSVGSVVFTVVVFTVAELYISAGGMSVALAHTPTDQRPRYLATFNLGFAGATVVGPSMVSFGLSLGAVGWTVWAAVFACVGVVALTVPLRPRQAAAPVGAAVSAPAPAAEPQPT